MAIIEYNSDLDIKGRVFSNNVPNSTGSIVTWNATTNVFGLRTNAQIISDLNLSSSFVPYTGATANVNLGARSITSTGGFIGNASTATKLASIITTFTGTYPVTFNVNGTIYSHAGLTYTGSTGALAATTFIGALSGNATTATTLATSRTINGTSFNGSANITTANWGTARNIKIGNTTKSVNGSANVSWSLAEIGIPDVTGFIPYTGADKPINLNTQNLRIGGDFNKSFSNFERSHLNPNETTPLHFTRLTDVVSFSRGNDSITQSDCIAITLPIRTSTQWVMEVDIYSNTLNGIFKYTPTKLLISAYSTDNRNRSVTVTSGVDDVKSISFCRDENNNTVIIIRPQDDSTTNFIYGKVNIANFYHSTIYNADLAVKSNYKVKAVLESSLTGLTTNGTIANAQFTRDSYLWNKGDFTQTNVDNWNTAYNYSQVGHVPYTGANQHIDLNTQKITHNGILSNVDSIISPWLRHGTSLSTNNKVAYLIIDGFIENTHRQLYIEVESVSGNGELKRLVKGFNVNFTNTNIIGSSGDSRYLEVTGSEGSLRYGIGEVEKHSDTALKIPLIWIASFAQSINKISVKVHTGSVSNLTFSVENDATSELTTENPYLYRNVSEKWVNSQLSGYVPTSRTITAGNGLSGGGSLAANRTITLGTPGAITLSSTNSVAASSHTHAFTPGGTTAQYIRGDGSLATYSDTTYTAGTGLSLSGTTFGQTITTSGTGTFVTGITQTTDGFQINLGTPPNTNTTYSNMAIAELNTGTVATGRVISASVLNQWLNGKDYVTNSALLASQQIYQYEVNVSNTLHDTLRDLDSKYLYEVNLVVTSTGTVTGAKQVIVYETNEWKVYDIGTVLKNSNHPYFEIIDNLPKLRTQHVTNYLVSVTVRKYRVVNADNNWKRYLGVDFEALLDKPTTLVGYGITNGVETSRTITINGVTQNLSANRSWTVADTITRLRGTTSGTYASGDLTLLAGANTTITQSGTNITIASTNTNTTYTAGNGLTLSGTAFSITKATATGTGNVVSDYNVTSTGIQLVKGITAMETSHVANGITSTLITNWNTAFTNNHTHSNKSNLDTINQNLGKTSDVLFGSINSNNITVLGLTFNMLELKRSGSTGSSVLFSNSTNGNLGKVGFGQNGDLYITKGASADSSADLLMISGSTGLPRFSGLSGSGTRVVSIGTDGTLAPITPTIDYILGAGNSTSKNIKFIGEGSIISEANGTKLNMLAHQKFINETSTGILTIKHATVASATMFDVVIKVYGYKSKYMGEYRIAFYQYSATSIHASTGYIIGTGNLPSKVVKVGLDADGKISIMIGDTTTSWSSHLSYTLERVETKHNGFSNSSWDNGWTSEMVTSLTGYTSIVTIPMTDIGGNYDLPTASASVLGGVKVGTNLSINASGVLSATNTNTTYSAGNGLTLNSNNQFSIGRITSGSGNVVSDVTITSTGISVVKGITAMTTSHLANLIDQNLNKVSSPTFNSIELSATAPFIDFHYDNSTADYTSRIIENSLGGLNLISKTSLKYNVDDVTTPFLEIDRYKAILGANVSNFEAVYLKTVFGSLNFDDEGLIYRPNSINHSFGIEANINAYYDIELYGKLNSLKINGRGSLGSPLDLLNGTKLSNYVFADVSNKNALGTFRVEGTITKDGGIPVFARWGASILAQTGDTMFTLSANPITPEIFVSGGNTTNNILWNKKLAFSINNFTITATAFYESSLKKFKTNIKPFNKSGIELINSLDIVTFDRIDDKTKNKIGIIADDTSEEFLSEDKDAVDLYKTIFIQAKAIQELSRENKELVNKNNELEKRLERLERMLENLLEK